MMGGLQVDLIEELKLRRWARANYAPVAERDPEWHPVVLDEMRCRDHEHAECRSFEDMGTRIVPVIDSGELRLDGEHEIPAPHVAGKIIPVTQPELFIG